MVGDVSKLEMLSQLEIITELERFRTKERCLIREVQCSPLDLGIYNTENIGILHES